MGISIWQLLIVLAIVIVLFGTKRLRNIGGDLGGAIKGFKNAMNEGENEKPKAVEEDNSSRVIEGEKVEEKEKTE